MFGKFAAALVHIYTSLGSLLAFLAMLYTTEGNFSGAFLMLMIAMLVDYSDGTLARRVRIKSSLPLVDGSTLDHIVDFVTSAFVPAFILWKANLLPLPQLLWTMLILAATLYKFSKTYNPWLGQGFFTGVPTPWITLSYYLYFFRPGHIVSGAFIIILVLLTCLPLKFIHIARFPHWRLANAFGLGCWWIIYLGITQGWTESWRIWLIVSLGYPAFYIATSWKFGTRFIEVSDKDNHSN